MNIFSRLPPHKPLTAMSSLAPSEMLEERVDSTSPVSSCRSGSTRTSLQTSVRRFAVKSLILLWRIEGNPPLEQERACSTEKEAPQTQCEGVRAGSQPYLRHRASTKAPLCKQKPCSLMGRVVSQLEEPFSLARVIARWRVGVSSACRLLAEAVSCSAADCRSSDLIRVCLASLGHTPPAPPLFHQL